MKQLYKITLTVEAGLASTIVGLLADSGTTFNMEPVATPVAKTKKGGYVNGRRDKGIKAEDLVLKILNGGRATPNELVKGFVDHGFAETSWHPTVSKLVVAGKVKRDGKYIVQI